MEHTTLLCVRQSFPVVVMTGTDFSMVLFHCLPLWYQVPAKTDDFSRTRRSSQPAHNWRERWEYFIRPPVAFPLSGSRAVNRDVLSLSFTRSARREREGARPRSRSKRPNNRLALTPRCIWNLDVPRLRRYRFGSGCNMVVHSADRRP